MKPIFPIGFALPGLRIGIDDIQHPTWFDHLHHVVDDPVRFRQVFKDMKQRNEVEKPRFDWVGTHAAFKELNVRRKVFGLFNIVSINVFIAQVVEFLEQPSSSTANIQYGTVFIRKKGADVLGCLFLATLKEITERELKLCVYTPIIVRKVGVLKQLVRVFRQLNGLTGMAA